MHNNLHTLMFLLLLLYEVFKANLTAGAELKQQMGVVSVGFGVFS